MGNQPVSYTPADSIRPLVSALPLERDLPAHNATMTDWVNAYYAHQSPVWYGPVGDTTPGRAAHANHCFWCLVRGPRKQWYTVGWLPGRGAAQGRTRTLQDARGHP